MRHIDKFFAADTRLMSASYDMAKALANPGNSRGFVDACRDELRGAAEEFGRRVIAVTRGGER